MSIKRVALQQYREILNRAGQTADRLRRPNEGWIRTARTALGLSVQQLAKRLGVTRAYAYKVEHAELAGGLTLKKMDEIARAMDCQFVYAFVPAIAEGTVEATLRYRALRQAREIVAKTHTNMALESQAVPLSQLEAELNRVADEILADNADILWERP